MATFAKVMKLQFYVTYIVNSSSHSGVAVFFLTSVLIFPFCPSTMTSQYGLQRTEQSRKGLYYHEKGFSTLGRDYTTMRPSVGVIAHWTRVILPYSTLGRGYTTMRPPVGVIAHWTGRGRGYTTMREVTAHWEGVILLWDLQLGS